MQVMNNSFGNVSSIRNVENGQIFWMKGREGYVFAARGFIQRTDGAKAEKLIVMSAPSGQTDISLYLDHLVYVPPGIQIQPVPSMQGLELGPVDVEEGNLVLAENGIYFAFSAFPPMLSFMDINSGEILQNVPDKYFVCTEWRICQTIGDEVVPLQTFNPKPRS